MSFEIERKFLTAGNFEPEAYAHEEIVQGYLSSHPERAVRVRIKGNKAYLTIKGIGNESGVSRYEWEKEIPVSEAKELMQLCEPGVIDKVRYYIKKGKHTFEVDKFGGDNEGLIVAEIELSSEDEVFERPHWLGQEVTGQANYYNSSLVKHPYTRWASADGK